MSPTTMVLGLVLVGSKSWVHELMPATVSVASAASPKCFIDLFIVYST